MKEKVNNIITKLEKIVKEEKMDDELKAEFKQLIQKVNNISNKEDSNAH